MSTTTTAETDDDLAELQERLEAIEYDTLGGGRCLATVTDIRGTARGDSVRVVAELPSGREYDETFTVPEVADDSSRLVRFLEARGYGLSTIDHLVGSDVEVEVTDDRPEYVVPEPDRPWLKRAADRIPDTVADAAGAVAVLSTWPASGVVLAFHESDDPDATEPDMLEFVLIYILFFGIWTIGALLLYPFLSLPV